MSWTLSSDTLKLQYLAIWCEELTHMKRPWCWERLRAGGKGDDRGWDGWMVSLTQWAWVWVDSRSWWWTGRPGVLWFMGSQKVRHAWVIELNWILSGTVNSSEHTFLCIWLILKISLKQIIKSAWSYTAIFKVVNQQEPTIWHMELCSVLCGSLDGSGVRGRMDTCICMAESLHCSPETIIT